MGTRSEDIDMDMGEECGLGGKKVEENEVVENDISNEDKEMVTKVFNKFDSDGTGAVSISELGNIMRSIGMFPTDDEVDDLLEYMDNDGSGVLELDELEKHMAQQVDDTQTSFKFKSFFLRFI